jgi:orotidine-5'-phosphate decarboxylase
MKMKSSSQLCVALDVTSKDEASSWVSRLQKYPLIFKFGLKLLPLLDAEFLKRAKEGGQKIFIDAKLHDIPTQVADAVATWQTLGADYLTIHLSGGAPMIAAATQAARKTEILGVSVLTSVGPQDLKDDGDPRTLENLMDRRADLAFENGVRWVVSAASDVSRIRARHKELKSVTPGLTFEAGTRNPDQARTATVEAAVKLGIEMLVVGRSILSAPQPEKVVESILELIHS